MRKLIRCAAFALLLSGCGDPVDVMGASSAIAAGKPLSISFYPLTQVVTEGHGATFTLNKSGGNGRPTSVKITTSDGSFSASVTAGSSFTIPTKDDAIVNGTRAITVTGIASTGAKAIATITVLDNDVAPPPPTPVPTPTPAPSPTPTPTGGNPCFDYSGKTPLGPVPGSNCPARMCSGSPNPVDWSQPCPPQSTAITVGGLVKVVSGDFTGLTFRVRWLWVDTVPGESYGKLMVGGRYYSGTYFLSNEPSVLAEDFLFYEDELAVVPA